MARLFQKTLICSALLFSAPFAVADDDCVKPKVKGYSQDEIICLGQDLVKVYDSNGQWDEYGVIVFDKNGKTLLPKGKFNDVFEFSEGLAGVITKDDKAGFIDKSGKMVIAPIFEPAIVGEGGDTLEVNSFNEGLVSVARLSRGSYGEDISNWGFINKAGETVIPFKYASAGNFGNGLAPVAIMDDSESQYIWGYIDKAGKTKIAFNYDYANSFSNGVASVAKNEKYGVIDTNNKIIVPFKYDYIDTFSDGLAAVFQRGRPLPNSDSVTGKFGFIDKTGRVVIPIQYDLEYYPELILPKFKNGKAKIEIWQGETYKGYCINKTGKKVSC